jgi:hypothetical protein
MEAKKCKLFRKQIFFTYKLIIEKNVVINLSLPSWMKFTNKVEEIFYKEKYTVYAEINLLTMLQL